MRRYLITLGSTTHVLTKEQYLELDAQMCTLTMGLNNEEEEKAFLIPELPQHRHVYPETMVPKVEFVEVEETDA